MNLKQRIKQDLEKALKSQDAARLSVLRMLSAAIHNREIEKRSKGNEPELTEDEMVAVLRSEVKKRKDAVEEFTKGGRQDLADKEAAELKILKTYLPPELSDEEIEKVVREVTASFGGVTSEFGRVMGETMKRIRGRASGERVSEAVRKALGT